MKRYELYEGNCFDFLQEAQALGVAAVITDPPYGKKLKNNAAGKQRREGSFFIAGDDSMKSGLKLAAWCEENKLPTCFFADPLLPWPGKWRQALVWDKGGAVGGGGDVATCWKQTWELIQVARNKPLNGFRDGAVLRFPMIPSDSAEHPAAKSPALMEYLIEKLTQPGDLVLDPFMGSGTTGVAAVKLGRRFLGCEIDPGHFETASRRIAYAAGTPIAMPKPQEGALSLF